MTSKLKIAVIGYGYWGPNLVRNFWKNPTCEVTDVVDFEQSRLDIVKRDYPSIKTSKDFQKILNDNSIDCIAIATPVKTHFELVKKSLQAKKHVLVEKPLTNSFNSSKKLIELAKKVNRVLIVDNTYLYTPAIQKISKIINSNSIGEIQYLDSTRINLGKFQPDVNVLWDLATHDISICLYLLQESPKFIQAVGKSHTKSGLADIAYLTLHFNSNKIAHFTSSWISPVKIRNTLIGGSKKMIVFNDLETTEKIKIYDSSYKNKFDPEHTKKFLTDYRIGDIFIPKIPQIEGLKNMAEDFISSIQNNKEPISNFNLGLEIVKILESAQKSIKNDCQMVIL